MPVAGNPGREAGHTEEKHPGLNVTATMVSWRSRSESANGTYFFIARD